MVRPLIERQRFAIAEADDALMAERNGSDGELEVELSAASLERVMDELQRDLHAAVDTVRQVFIDPIPAMETRPVARVA